MAIEEKPVAGTDRDLILQAVAGGGEALSELLKRHGPGVQASLQIGQHWQAVLEPADVMQVTYLEAFMRITSFDPNRADAFPAWLRQIAHNNLRDAVRGLERQKQPQPKNRVHPGRHEDSLAGLYNLLGATNSTPSVNLRKNEAVNLLESSIQALPERYARVIRLYDLESRPINEVAAEMGKSPGAIHMLRARAHDRLRELLGSASTFFSKP